MVTFIFTRYYYGCNKLYANSLAKYTNTFCVQPYNSPAVAQTYRHSVTNVERPFKVEKCRASEGER